MVNLTFMLLCIILGLFAPVLQAFVMPQANRFNSINLESVIQTGKNKEHLTISWAKKRRRRKEPTQKKSDDDVEKSPSLDDNALPDFDLDETPSASVDTPSRKTTKSSAGVDMNDPKVLDAMKGTSNKVRMTQELERDRELEKRFQFDGVDIKDTSLPTNLASIRSKESGGQSKMGKKAARNEARRIAAIEAKEAEESSESILNKLPIGQKDGKFNYLKFVEQGTWAGIFILVAWEVYINTPLFNRAAPLSPVVFESPSQLFLP